MLKLLLTTSCLLAVCQAVFPMPQMGIRTTMGGTIPSIFNFGRFSMDFSKYRTTSLQDICQDALNMNGGRVSDYLSDVMRDGVKFLMKSGQTPAQMVGRSANAAQWSCLMNSVTARARTSGQISNAVGDYFDTAAELPIQRYLPFGVKYNPCQMVFCGEQGMTPMAMMRSMMQLLRRRRPLGHLGATVFGALAPRIGMGANLFAGQGMGQMGTPGNAMGQMGTPGNSNGQMGTSSNSMGQTGTSGNTNGQTGASSNGNGQMGTPGNTMGQTGASSNGNGQTSGSSGSQGQTSAATGGSSGGLNPSPQNPWQENSLMQMISGQAGGMNNMMATMNKWKQMAAMLSGSGNNGAAAGAGSGSGGSSMLERMMGSMGQGGLTPTGTIDSQPAASSPAANTNTAGGMSNMMAAMNKWKQMAAMLAGSGNNGAAAGAGSGTGGSSMLERMMSSMGQGGLTPTGTIDSQPAASSPAANTNTAGGVNNMMATMNKWKQMAAMLAGSGNNGAAAGAGSGSGGSSMWERMMGSMGQGGLTPTGTIDSQSAASSPAANTNTAGGQAGRNTLSNIMNAMLLSQMMQDPPERPAGRSLGLLGSGGMSSSLGMPSFSLGGLAGLPMGGAQSPGLTATGGTGNGEGMGLFGSLPMLLG